MRKLIIRNGRVIDPANGLDKVADVLIEEDKIAALGEKLQVSGAERHAIVNVLPIGAITKGSAGEELSAIGSMKQAGIVAISDDGRPVMNARVMRRAME